MAPGGPDRWSVIRERTLSTPEVRERYRRTRAHVEGVRRMLQIVDAERERAGLSKSELARRIGTSPATLRRLLTSPTANPTLKTLFDLFDALDVEVEVRPRREQCGGSRATSGTDVVARVGSS
jgi:ribosome-binding protein aMBF1 (putative translation factor)